MGGRSDPGYDLYVQQYGQYHIIRFRLAVVWVVFRIGLYIPFRVRTRSPCKLRGADWVIFKPGAELVNPAKDAFA